MTQIYMCDDFRVGISEKILQRLHVGTHLLWIKPVQRLTISNQERNNKPKVSILNSYHLYFLILASPDELKQNPKKKTWILMVISIYNG